MALKRAHVIGFGASGKAAAKLLLKHGWNVIVSDQMERRQASELVSELIEAGAVVFMGGHEKALEVEVDLAVISPGVPMKADIVEKLVTMGVPIISELELGWRFCRGSAAAVTGSNGKTTTTAMIGEIFAKSGRQAFTCGNIGLPISEIADQTTDETLLSIETSSFQLLTVDTFKPKVAVLLNLTPDHLDRHGDFESYANAKARVWLNHTTAEWLVYNQDDSRVVELVRDAGSSKFPFSLNEQLKKGAFYHRHELVAILPDGSEFIFKRSDLHLLGDHNVSNALAALSAALLIGVDVNSVSEGLRNFKSYPHRLETVRELDGVRWINDSKATNVDAGLVALEAIKQPIVLIAGGRPKGGGFRDLLRGPVERIKMCILIGEAAVDILRDIGSDVNVMCAQDLNDAVTRARNIARSGDAVLLSPLCASYDMFRNFEERGDVFKEIVNKLPGENGNSKKRSAQI